MTSDVSLYYWLAGFCGFSWAEVAKRISVTTSTARAGAKRFAERKGLPEDPDDLVCWGAEWAEEREAALERGLVGVREILMRRSRLDNAALCYYLMGWYGVPGEPVAKSMGVGTNTLSKMLAMASKSLGVPLDPLELEQWSDPQWARAEEIGRMLGVIEEDW